MAEPVLFRFIQSVISNDAAVIFLSDLADLLDGRRGSRVQGWQYATLTEKDAKQRFQRWLERHEE
jgi:hypothetical protein